MPGEIQRFGICVPKQTAQALRDPLLLGQAIDGSLNVRPAYGTKVGLDHALALASRDIRILSSMNRANEDTHLLDLLKTFYTACGVNQESDDPGRGTCYGMCGGATWKNSVRFLLGRQILEHFFSCLLYTSSEPTRLGMISYAVFCLKKKK